MLFQNAAYRGIYGALAKRDTALFNDAKKYRLALYDGAVGPWQAVRGWMGSAREETTLGRQHKSTANLSVPRWRAVHIPEWAPQRPHRKQPIFHQPRAIVSLAFRSARKAHVQAEGVQRAFSEWLVPYCAAFVVVFSCG